MASLDLDDADGLEELADRVDRAVRTAGSVTAADSTEKRLLSQVRIWGDDLSRSCRELAEHVRHKP